MAADNAAWRQEFVALNTDREIWRKGGGDGNGMSYYEPSIHVTQQGDIGINVGGMVYVLPVEEWHRLADESHKSGKVVYDEDDLHPDGTPKWSAQPDA